MRRTRQPDGIFDNRATMRREFWCDGGLVAAVSIDLIGTGPHQGIGAGLRPLAMLYVLEMANGPTFGEYPDGGKPHG